MPKWVYRDLACLSCGNVQLDQMVEGLALPVRHECTQCNDETSHEDVGSNTGGANKRYRYSDFSDDPRDYRGQIEFGGLSATMGDENGPDSTFRKTGEAMTSLPRFTCTDRADERRDRHYHKTDTKRGTRPLYFDRAR